MNVIDILSDNLDAWDGEEDSVREEHADLIEATRACLDSVDARLIAAAPDLLAALEWAVDTADAEQYEADWYADARMAIAKAKGDE
jgi:hypothetical protein